MKSIHFEVERDLVWIFPFVESSVNVGEILEYTSKFGGTNKTKQKVQYSSVHIYDVWMDKQ